MDPRTQSANRKSRFSSPRKLTGMVPRTHGANRKSRSSSPRISTAMDPRTQGANRISRFRRNLTTMNLPAICAFIGVVLFFFSKNFLRPDGLSSPVPRLQEIEPSSANLAGSFRESGWKQKSDSVHELSSASEKRTDVVFFHGLRLGPAHEAHLSSWKSRSKTGEVWLMWLHEDNPSLRILAVSYDASMKKDSRNGRMDIYQVSENLLRELITRGVGQTGPVIFVGHSFGGIISKEICRQAHQNRDLGDDILKRTTLLKNLRGLFCFGVPHRGSLFTNVVEKLNFEKGELVDYVKVLNKDLARLNDVFDRLCTKYEWKVAGVGESKPTKLKNGFCDIIVEEASARCGDFSILEEDHFSLCQPKSRDSSSYTILVEFIDKIQRKVTNIATNDQEGEQIQQQLVKQLASQCCGMVGVVKRKLSESFSCLWRSIET